MKILDTTALNQTLSTIESYIPQGDQQQMSISKVNVAWHLDHSLKVINAVINSMQNSDPSMYKNNFTLLGRVVLTLNYIPRGKGKAPKYVVASKIITEQDINAQLAEARQKIAVIPKLDKNAYFKHPIFGNINTSRVIRFLDAHTNHHLKIVKSILK